MDDVMELQMEMSTANKSQETEKQDLPNHHPTRLPPIHLTTQPGLANFTLPALGVFSLISLTTLNRIPPYMKHSFSLQNATHFRSSMI